MGKVSHPEHYGGADNPYEAIKVIEAWGLNFALGSVLKYVARAGKKPEETDRVAAEARRPDLDDLRKAAWYLNREIARREARTAEAVAGGRESI